MPAKSLQHIVLSTLMLLVATAPGSARAAQSSFDGRWSVVIITDAGTCDRSYRYGLVVSQGRIYQPATAASLFRAASIRAAAYP